MLAYFSELVPVQMNIPGRHWKSNDFTGKIWNHKNLAVSAQQSAPTTLGFLEIFCEMEFFQWEREIENCYWITNLKSGQTFPKENLVESAVLLAGEKVHTKKMKYTATHGVYIIVHT